MEEMNSKNWPSVVMHRLGWLWLSHGIGVICVGTLDSISRYCSMSKWGWWQEWLVAPVAGIMSPLLYPMFALNSFIIWIRGDITELSTLTYVVTWLVPLLALAICVEYLRRPWFWWLIPIAVFSGGHMAYIYGYRIPLVVQ